MTPYRELNKEQLQVLKAQLEKEFEEVKKLGYIGIPAILTDDNKINLGDEVLQVK